MSAAALNRSVLVLNRQWLAIHICDVKRALCLLCGGLAKVVDETYQVHDFASWQEVSDARTDPDMIHTPRFQLRVPEVIVLSRYSRRPPQAVKFSRRNICLRDRYQCQYCGDYPRREELTLDHVSPRSRGGKTTWENVVVACVDCNTRKANRLPHECGMVPRTEPVKPQWPLLSHRTHDVRPRSLWQRFIDSAYWNALLEE